MKKLALSAMLAAAVFGSLGTASADQLFDVPCTGPFPRSTPTFPSVCDIVPQICDDDPIILSQTGDAVVSMGKPVAQVAKNQLSPAQANQKIRTIAGAELAAIGVPPAVVNQALAAIGARNQVNLPRVKSGSMSFAAALSDITDIYLGAAEQGDDVQALAATVTTTTNGGFEINFGIFKIFVNQTVTTVETTDDEGEGYSETCDASGECVCEVD